MKTLDEVIKALEICASSYCSNHDGDCPYLGQYECNEEQRNLDALFYLKEYRWVQENCADALAEKYPSENVPLTWDELKQKEGKPIWVETEYYPPRWAVITDANDNRVRFVGKQLLDSEGREDLGKTWQAYRKERK